MNFADISAAARRERGVVTDVTVTSELGVGSTFVVALPVHHGPKLLGKDGDGDADTHTSDNGGRPVGAGKP